MDAAFVFNTISQCRTNLRKDLNALVGDYKSGLRTYHKAVGLPWGAKDYATHSEIMFLYDV